MNASEALALIQADELLIEEYARCLLERVKQRDGVIHAWAHLDEDLILDQARKLDAVPKSKRGPIHGLPVGIKDIFLTKDMPTRYNSPIHDRDSKAAVDSAPVMALRAEGALIFGKTTTCEFAIGIEGPVTANPHDIRRSPGGSSAGSGAAVADLQIPVALGTQTNGSVIQPASFNGVYAFKLLTGNKPTWGAISLEGGTSIAPSVDTIGFFGRSVADLELMASVFQLTDDEEIPSSPFSIGSSHIAFCNTAQWPHPDKCMATAMDAAWDMLHRHGANLEKLVLPPDFDRIAHLHDKVWRSEGRAAFLSKYLEARDQVSTDVRDVVENSNSISRAQQIKAYNELAELRSLWDDLAKEYDIVVTPSGGEAPVGKEGPAIDDAFCKPWTALHVPTLNVPGFAGSNNMPIGLSLVGPRYRDLHLLRIANAIGLVFENEGGFVSRGPAGSPSHRTPR